VPVSWIWCRFGCKDTTNRDVDFETADDITGETTAEEIDKLKDFDKEGGNDVWMALYADGKTVEFEDYREAYEEWLELTTQMVPVEATEECFPDGLKVLALDSSLGMEQAFRILYAEHNDGSRSMKESLEKSSMKETIENCMLKCFAAADASGRLEDGEIESYDVIYYYVSTKGGINVRYQHYYQDKNWKATVQ